MNLEKALESGELVSGTITGKVKGGLTVMTNGIRAFLPGSLVDVRPVKDTSPFEGKTLDFKVIKLDRKRNNVVMSRRAVVEASMGEERAKLLETLREGAIVKAPSRTSPTTARCRPGRHRRPAPHHRSCLAPRASSERGRDGGSGDHGQGLKFDQEKNRSRSASSSWARIRGSPRPPLSAGHAAVRQGHQHHRLRLVRRDRGRHRRPGARVEMDWTNKNIDPRRSCRWATKSK